MPAASAQPAPKSARSLRIYFNQRWGSVRTESRSFGISDKEVWAGTDDKATLPLFGFELQQESYLIARWDGAQARVYPPPRAAVSREGALDRDEAGPYLLLKAGDTVELREGDQCLSVTVDHQRERAGWDKHKAAFWLIFLIIATVGGPLMFLLASPDMGIIQRALTEARVKQGLPAQPEHFDFKESEAAEAQHGKGVTIPASVR